MFKIIDVKNIFFSSVYFFCTSEPLEEELECSMASPFFTYPLVISPCFSKLNVVKFDELAELLCVDLLI